VLCAPAVLLAWLLAEPPKTEARHAYMETGRRAVALTFRSPALFTVMLLMSATTLAISAMGVLQQFFLREAGVPLWGIGVGVAAQMGLGAAGSWLADPVGRRLGLRRVFWIMPVMSALALTAAVPGSAWLFPIFILPAAGWNLMYPHFTVYLARRAPEALRASVISVSNLVSGGASLIVVPLAALGVDRIGFRPTLLVLSAALLLVTVVAYLAWTRAEGNPDDPDHPDGPDSEDGQALVDAPDTPLVPSV